MRNALGKISLKLQACTFGLRATITSFALASAAALSFNSTAFAARLTAKSGNSSDVQSAISSARVGDTVQVPKGSYAWNSGITLNKSVTLDFQGASVTYNGQSPAVEIDEQTDGNPTLANLNLNSGSMADTTSSPKLVGCYGYTGFSFVIHDCHFHTNSNEGNDIRV